MVQEFLRGKSAAHLVMLAAIALLFVSQFFPYFDDPFVGSLGYATNTDYYTTLQIISFGQQGTGWQLHPHAWVTLVVLAFAFLREDIYGHPLFNRFGWWLAVILVIASIIPGAPFRAFGAGLGGIASLMAVGAALVHQFGRKTPATTAGPGGPE